MTHPNELVACFDYRDSVWELPVAVPQVSRCLLAWRTTPVPLDAGMPLSVASLFASALASHALVSFATGVRGHVSFVHASRPEDVLQAFAEPYFNWSRRAQVIFLSAAESEPPALSERHLRLAYESEAFDVLSSIGVTGLLLPGVDGDVAGLYAFSRNLGDRLTSGFKKACADVGADWRSVSESELRELLARRG